MRSIYDFAKFPYREDGDPWDDWGGPAGPLVYDPELQGEDRGGGRVAGEVDVPEFEDPSPGVRREAEELAEEEGQYPVARKALNGIGFVQMDENPLGAARLAVRRARQLARQDPSGLVWRDPSAATAGGERAAAPSALAGLTNGPRQAPADDAAYELPRVDLAHAVAAASVKARTGKPLHEIYRTLGHVDRDTGKLDPYDVPLKGDEEAGQRAWLSNLRRRVRMGDQGSANALAGLYPGADFGDLMGGRTPIEEAWRRRDTEREAKAAMAAQAAEARGERVAARTEDTRRWDAEHGLRARQVSGQLEGATQDRQFRAETAAAQATYQQGLLELKRKVADGEMRIAEANAATQKLNAERQAALEKAQLALAQRADQRAEDEHGLKMKLAGAAAAEAAPERQDAKVVMAAAMQQAQAQGMAPEEAYRWARDLAESTQGILAEYSWPEPALAVTAARKVRQMKAAGTPEAEIRQYLQWLSTGG